MIDLDRFKFVNDSRGHRFGDAVLAEIGRRIKDWARPNDVVARFGGDEFTALLRGPMDPATAVSLADSLQSTLSAPIVLGDLTIRTTASVGICLWSPAVQSADEMLQSADAAAYRAKANGRACSIVYDTDMASRDRIRNRIGTELRFALERHQLRVVYQPVFESRLRRCVGFEALLRWSHPELGDVSPGMFIPIAEESGLIAPIGNFVLRQAGRQLAVFRDHFASCTMNVNVSTQQFVDPKFLTELEATLQETGLPGASFGLEITETTMLDGERLAGDLIDGIRRTGARLVLDDFGTGYSSFGYLQRLPIDALKIDQRFVKGRDDGLASPPIVRALLALSDSMNIAVVAEGVETEQQAHELSSMGCRYLQGYLLSRPLEVADAMALLLARQDSERPASA
jgi:diguanylate cyclase (GGDEF)-like protein